MKPPMFFNAIEIVIDDFVRELKEGYSRTYGGLKPDYADIIGWAGNMALENLANCDALYHNLEHTILVTLVGQEILRGKHIREGGVSCEDWLHFIISLVCHDIGYVKGVCRGDRDGRHATGRNGETVVLPEGSTAASLTPYRVDRAKLFIQERFGYHKLIDAKQIENNIELTRFPISARDNPPDTSSYAALVRAAVPIGQLSDPRYLKKISALFYEFEEIGMNQQLGYRTPGDLRAHYTQAYWERVYPLITDAMSYLSLTQQGQQILANVYANVFVVEHHIAEKS
jgi:hypothetical protein